MKTSRQQKRNVYVLTEGMYAPSSKESDSWVCTYCDQVLKSEQVEVFETSVYHLRNSLCVLFCFHQGARTHCYQVHCLQAEGSKLLRSSITESMNPKDRNLDAVAGREGEVAHEFVDLLCVECSRSFRDSASLQQHRKAKHGAYPVLQPGWAMQSPQYLPMDKVATVDAPSAVHPNSSTLSTPSSSIECLVCGALFADAHELQMHAENGFRPVSVERLFKCPTCTRDFFDERALRQHCNFCLPDFLN